MSLNIDPSVTEDCNTVYLRKEDSLIKLINGWSDCWSGLTYCYCHQLNFKTEYSGVMALGLHQKFQTLLLITWPPWSGHVECNLMLVCDVMLGPLNVLLTLNLKLCTQLASSVNEPTNGEEMLHLGVALWCYNIYSQIIEINKDFGKTK